jgi:phosphoglycolate phosphatase
MNILFDLDGTLTDPKEGIVASIEYALVSLGHSVQANENFERFIGPPLRTSFSELLDTQDLPLIETAVARYRERFREIGMYENRVYHGIPRALESLCRSRSRLFIATSKPQLFAEQILEHFDLARYFIAVYGCDLDGSLSEKGQLIAHILAAEQLHDVDTLMVGDRHHDACGAIANGIAPVGVLWGYGTYEELMQAGVCRFLRRPDELAGLVAG